MQPPFYRACRKHKEELEDRTKMNTGPEILWCHRGGGHRCRSWLVLDGLGETIAVGHLNTSPQIVSAELARIDFPVPDPPDKFCQRGHYEWYLETDGRYRCRICRRDRMLRKYYDNRPVVSRPSAKKRSAYAKELLQAAQERAEQKKLNSRLRKEQRCKQKML
jgi:hypothetical protein